MPRPARLKNSSVNTASVEYQRSDEAQLLVPETAIATELADAGSSLNAAKSVAYLWAIPGPESTKRGNLISLIRCNITVTNDGPFPTRVRVERPLGFESDPTGIAYWEPLSRQEQPIEPQKVRSFKFGFINNNFVVPKREFIESRDCVHLFSIAATRTCLTSGGTKPNAESLKCQVGLRVSVKIVYVSDGQGVGKEDAFVARLYQTTSHMDYTNYPPPPSVSVGQLRCAEGQVKYARFVNAYDDTTGGQKGDPCPVILSVSHDGGNHFADVDGLDVTSVYALDGPLTCYSCVSGVFPVSVADAYTTNCRYLRYGAPPKNLGKFKVGWYLCVAPANIGADKSFAKSLAYFLDRDANKKLNLGINVNFLKEPSLAARLTALVVQVKPVGVRGKHKLAPLRASPKPRQSVQALPWYDTLVSAVTIITKVLKVAFDVAEVIAAATLLEQQIDGEYAGSSEEEGDSNASLLLDASSCDLN